MQLGPVGLARASHDKEPEDLSVDFNHQAIAVPVALGPFGKGE